MQLCRGGILARAERRSNPLCAFFHKRATPFGSPTPVSGSKPLTPRRYRRLRAILERRQIDLTILMDNVHKPHNVSAVLRTCDAVGIGTVHVVVPPGAGYSPRHDSAGGSGRWVDVRRHPDHEAAGRHLHAEGMQIVVAHLTDDAVDFRSIDYTRPTAVLLGSELDGPGADALAIADLAVTIPMFGAVASLNVSVAAAVILYEAQRQRSAAGCYDEPRLGPEAMQRLLFEWGWPEIAELCRRRGQEYPPLGPDGQILGPVPRG